jgi:hypothetical protein
MISTIRASIMIAMLAAAPLHGQEPVQPTTAQPPAQREGVVGVGLQFTWPTYGLSGMLDLGNDWSVQGVIGSAGYGLSLTARALYRLDPQEEFRPYAYGEIGRWSDYAALGTVPHFGLGGGVEFDIRDFAPDAPPIYASFELGLNVGVHRSAELGNTTLLRLQLGPALHYRF